MTNYTSVEEINRNQKEIMLFIDFWVHEKKTPVPQKEVIICMKAKNVPEPTIIYELQILLKKGYIRRAVTISNKRTYVQLKRV